MKERIDLVFVEWAGEGGTVDPHDPVALSAEKLGPLARRVVSLDDLVQKAMHASAGREIGCLDIVGHGSPGQLNVGESFNPRGRYRVLNSCPGTFRKLFGLKTSDALTASSTIRLLGCSTGDARSYEPDGRGTMALLARSLGCTVQGVLGSLLPSHFGPNGFRPRSLPMIVAGPDGTVVDLPAVGEEAALLLEGTPSERPTWVDAIEELHVRAPVRACVADRERVRHFLAAFDYTERFDLDALLERPAAKLHLVAGPKGARTLRLAAKIQRGSEPGDTFLTVLSEDGGASYRVRREEENAALAILFGL